MQRLHHTAARRRMPILRQTATAHRGWIDHDRRRNSFEDGLLLRAAIELLHGHPRPAGRHIRRHLRLE